MWDPMPICILQEKHIYHLFFILFECIPFNTQSSICTTIHKEQNVGIQSQCLDMQCLFYFAVFKCLHFPLFISCNFITRTCPLDKKMHLFHYTNYAYDLGSFICHKEVLFWYPIIFSHTLEKLTYHQHQKLINFIGLFKICTKFVISWVCVVEIFHHTYTCFKCMSHDICV